jgi:predicted RNA-binding Zn-ribbon protein involved in translation (DUF1610 family)
MMDQRHTMPAQHSDADAAVHDAVPLDRDMAVCTDSLSDGCDFSCPVCGADQIPADECRRCRADLALFQKLRLEVDKKRVQCLALIRQRRLLRATQTALECLELSADERNTRLLATCYLLQGDFASAILTRMKSRN